MTFAEFKQTVEEMMEGTWRADDGNTPGTTSNNGLFVFWSDTKQDLELIELPGFVNDYVKEAVVYALRMTVNKFKLIHTCFISEAFMISAKCATDEEKAALRAFLDSGARYNTHPDAVEVLHLHFATVEEPHNQWTDYHVNRTGETPTLVKQPSLDTADPNAFSGRFANLYYGGF